MDSANGIEDYVVFYQYYGYTLSLNTPYCGP